MTTFNAAAVASELAYLRGQFGEDDWKLHRQAVRAYADAAKELALLPAAKASVFGYLLETLARAIDVSPQKFDSEFVIACLRLIRVLASAELDHVGAVAMTPQHYIAIFLLLQRAEISDELTSAVLKFFGPGDYSVDLIGTLYRHVGGHLFWSTLAIRLRSLPAETPDDPLLPLRLLHVIHDSLRRPNRRPQPAQCNVLASAVVSLLSARAGMIERVERAGDPELCEVTGIAWCSPTCLAVRIAVRLLGDEGEESDTASYRAQLMRHSHGKPVVRHLLPRVPRGVRELPPFLSLDKARDLAEAVLNAARLPGNVASKLCMAACDEFIELFGCYYYRGNEDGCECTLDRELALSVLTVSSLSARSVMRFWCDYSYIKCPQRCYLHGTEGIVMRIIDLGTRTGGALGLLPYLCQYLKNEDHMFTLRNSRVTPHLIAAQTEPPHQRGAPQWSIDPLSRHWLAVLFDDEPIGIGSEELR